MRHFFTYLSKVFILGLAFSIVMSCDKINAEQADSNEIESNPSKDSYIASSTAITRTIKSSSLWSSEYVIYEDFNIKHELVVGSGCIGISTFERVDGAWAYSGDKRDRGGFKSVGTNKDLSGITAKCAIGDGARDINDHSYYVNIVYVADIQPNYGYTGCFLTSDGTYKYIRLIITGYTLDEDGALESVTVQYQLF